MSDRVALVTGSTSGIGAAIARRLASDGYVVALHGRRSAAEGEAMTKEAGAASYHSTDLSDVEHAGALVRSVLEKHGRLDALVNNAGTTKFVDLKDLDGISAADFQNICAVNVVGPFQMIRAFAPLLRNSASAAVVNISSIAPLIGGGSSVAYIASKGALNALSLVLARVLGPEIRVNVVAPGMVDSPWLRNGLGPERFAAMLRNYESTSALNSLVLPEEVAETVYYLGAVASKTTGEVHLVDGGRRLGR